MTEKRIILRCACLAKVFSDSIAVWRIGSGRKWWRERKPSANFAAICRALRDF